MGFSLRLWDADGTVSLDETMTTATILGLLTIDYASNPNGSLVNASFAEGTPFAMVLATGEVTPLITIAGTTLTWARSKNSAGQFPPSGVYNVLYGVA
jgi:hypothetical protein